MEKRAFFLDLDGTVLTDDKAVSPENMAALRSALADGHQIVIASGRHKVSVAGQAARLGLDGPGCYWITSNGAVVYDCGQGREILRRPLPLEDLYALFREARRRGIYIQAYDRDGRVTIERGSDLKTLAQYCSITGMESRIVDDVRQGITDAPEKAVVIDYQGREATEPLRQWILREMAGRVDDFYSSPWLLENVAAGVDKGTALVEVCRLLDIPVQNSVAAGDEANDIAMIRAAGVGFAMANAQEEVKAAADCVTERDNNHSGVAEIFARVLGQEM